MNRKQTKIVKENIAKGLENPFSTFSPDELYAMMCDATSSASHYYPKDLYLAYSISGHEMVKYLSRLPNRYKYEYTLFGVVYVCDIEGKIFFDNWDKSISEGYEYDFLNSHLISLKDNRSLQTDADFNFEIWFKKDLKGALEPCIGREITFKVYTSPNKDIAISEARIMNSQVSVNTNWEIFEVMQVPIKSKNKAKETKAIYPNIENPLFE